MSHNYLDEDFLVLKEKVLGGKCHLGFTEMETFEKWNSLASLSYNKFPHTLLKSLLWICRAAYPRGPSLNHHEMHLASTILPRNDTFFYNILKVTLLTLETVFLKLFFVPKASWTLVCSYYLPDRKCSLFTLTLWYLKISLRAAESLIYSHVTFSILCLILMYTCY